MKKILYIAQKEYRTFFKLPIGYVFTALFLGLTNWLFFQNFFLRQEIDIRPYFDSLPLMLLILTPALTMRIFAEEKSLKTEEILLTLPLSENQIVLGKFLGSFLLLLTVMIFSLPVFISLMFLGRLDIGVVSASYLGALMLGGFYLSIGLFISSCTQNQIVAFLLTLFSAFIFYIIGSDLILLSASGFPAEVLKYFSVITHFSNFARGVIDSRDLIYFFSLTFYFLYLTKIKIESRF